LFSTPLSHPGPNRSHERYGPTAVQTYSPGGLPPIHIAGTQS
jgi:hypothetical protein